MLIFEGIYTTCTCTCTCTCTYTCTCTCTRICARTCTSLQALSIEKLRIIVSTLTRGLEELTRRVEEAARMEQAYLAIRNIEFLGPFYAFQMVADLGEHGLLAFRYFHHPHLSHLSHLSSPPLLASTHLQPSENSFVVLGGGAKRGLQMVEGEVSVDPVLQLKNLAKVSGGG